MNEENLWKLWGTMKRNNIFIIGIPEGEAEEKGTETTYKAIMAENFLSLQRKMNTSNRLNPNAANLKHIIIKLPKSQKKKRILRVGIEKREAIYKKNPYKTTSEFLNRDFSGQEKMG